MGEAIEPTRASVLESPLGYKFQRVREKLRDAIAAGELKGKLPGERVLAQRFNANPKTLSKALSDLAAEGLLVRSVGRGTFVASQLPEELTEVRWVIAADAGGPCETLVTELLRLNPQSTCVTPTDAGRPSLLATNTVVINCSRQLQEQVYRDLMIRGVPVIDAVCLPRTCSTHAVLLDRTLAGFSLARDLILAGHRHIAVVEGEGNTTLRDAAVWAQGRYGTAVIIDDVIRPGATAVICEAEELDRVPGGDGLSVCAVGMESKTTSCSGYYLDPHRQAVAIREVSSSLRPHRLSVVWLNGVFLDRGTMFPAPHSAI